MIMKKTILALACSVIISLTANAQESKRQMPDPAVQAASQVEKLNQIVNLTDAQKPKVLELTIANVKAMNELRQKPRTEGEVGNARRSEMQKLRTDYIVGLKTVLTAEQYAKIENEGSATANQKQAAPAPEKQ